MSSTEKEVKEKDCVNSEDASLQRGDERVKFSVEWKGTLDELLKDLDSKVRSKLDALCEEMADSVWVMEQSGVTPVMYDGKVGGNAAAVFEIGNKTFLVVTKSGKLAGKRLKMEEDICLVDHFDRKEWTAYYFAQSKAILPTSDTPLHSAALNAHKEFGWLEAPKVALHGHALETEAEAKKLGLPFSAKETLFSTPPDSQALLEIMETHRYPEHRVYIRNGHGFVALGKTFPEALSTFQQIVKPSIKH